MEHIHNKKCSPLIYEYDEKTLEIQGIVKDASGNNTCKVHLKWSDGTEMTCYLEYIGEIELIRIGFPIQNCSGSYLDTGCAGRCRHANSTNKTT